MANTYSALKRVRETERRTAFNTKNKSRLRHQIRSIRRAIVSKDANLAAPASAQDVFLDRPVRQERDYQEEYGIAV